MASEQTYIMIKVRHSCAMSTSRDPLAYHLLPRLLRQPDGVMRGLVAPIISKFEIKGFKVRPKPLYLPPL